MPATGRKPTIMALPTPSLRIWRKVSLQKKATFPNSINWVTWQQPQTNCRAPKQPSLLSLSTSLVKGNWQSLSLYLVRPNPGKLSARGASYQPVGDSRLCATHWGPWREVLLLSNLHFTVTPPPHPQCSGIRPDSVRDTKVQLKTPFSHLERPTGRGGGQGMLVGAKQVISQNKPRKSARSRVRELELNPREGTRRKLRHGGKSTSRRGRGPGIPPGAGAGSARGWGVGSSSGDSRACEPPPPRGRLLYSPLSIGGCRPLVAAGSAASRAVPRQVRAAPCPRGRGTPLVFLAASTRLRALGRPRTPGEEVP